MEPVHAVRLAPVSLVVEAFWAKKLVEVASAIFARVATREFVQKLVEVALVPDALVKLSVLKFARVEKRSELVLFVRLA